MRKIEEAAIARLPFLVQVEQFPALVDKVRATLESPLLWCSIRAPAETPISKGA